MRIARALALAGIDSRRKCEVHVLNGAIRVNGETVRDLGRQVDPDQDAICFRGRVLPFREEIYFLLNKPVGYLTSASDPHATKTVFDLLPKTLVRGTFNPSQGKRRVFPVGRLDKDSMGLILFTNDGALANKLIHPRYGIEKWYEIRLDRAFDERHKKMLLAGVRLKDGMARAEKVVVLSRRVVRVMIKEGRKREIRRMFDKLEYKVVNLLRIAFGPIALGALMPGRGRFLTKKEIEALKKAVISKPE